MCRSISATARLASLQGHAVVKASDVMIAVN
jgi:molybdopterin-binding protein